MNRADLKALDKDALIDLVLLQADRIEGLTGMIASLEARLSEAERQAHRGAAPFAKPEAKRSPSPKRPGRKGGHKGSHRRRPPEDAMERRVEVLLETCPHCAAALDPLTLKAVEQTIIEIPPVAPETIRLVTYRGRCGCCREKVASTHPLQTSMATGAAGTHLGPRALGIAAWLRAGLGLTMRKTTRVLGDLLGLDLTPGGLSQALARIAGKMKGASDALLVDIKAQGVLHTDETGWWVGGQAHSLWVASNDAGTAYRIVPSRTKAAARDFLGDYQGVLVSDCLNIYDDLTPIQHKCYAHHLKALSTALEKPGARGSPYLVDLRGLLHGAMALKEMMPDLGAKRVSTMRAALEASADRLLGAPREPTSSEPTDLAQARIEEKLRQRLAKQRDHLFTFLDHEDVDGTNNRAERDLRPAVITRKLSCGNKTQQGARTWEVLTSLAQTAHQKGNDFAKTVQNAMMIKPEFP